jgi:hypothetical protein
MFERSITSAEIDTVISKGEVVEEYPADTPYPCRILLGRVKERPIHVVAADNNEASETVIITVYEPDPKRWSKDFRTRRMK